ncbi:MBL fold metallo-hydrolase [Aetokthonos hydrillicola Thurmond2011]|jgi:L-ascorbate metabolism protein UlaG (beta-lactamase superfamily)|uniref:MBL fold metallo-hydrolase n=1 Tax=Aetokthonos hydrillicola Thurmond2011 TaxID=2712845 RepID=A0AAP5M8X9_9CYAN|nr:MBL fold metallo-hydrolase [Aetokthonos hydrillicola]MBO3458850.1 MBL fold metallo-hydrolase [Aetokthonos hydrillicola CCALA 1050]MBW4587302.1 MBL fold metallo-hydrolase [Aetokthonos hydrillicola CCALA 1050]MDR9896675.1 MBL fold metallo-hydrolase [Aetokthonos hydrillicola Thurmond2011]
MHLTWLNTNSWLIEIGGQRILLDPWLVGTLTFNNWDWLFKATHTEEHPIPQNVDLIVLSQGLEDHSHPETLKQLDKAIPVVASPNAAKVVKELGYTQVTALSHGESFTLNESLAIKATRGSLVGLDLVENGYLFTELNSNFKIYYEPHGNHSPELKEAAPVDVIITPLTDLALPVIGSIIKGGKNALEVAQWLKPQVMLPTAVGGEVVSEGLLPSVLQPKGSIEEFRTLLADRNLSTEVIEPKAGDRIQLELEKRSLV